MLDNVKCVALVKRVADFLGVRPSQFHRDNNGKPLPEHTTRFAASHVVNVLAMGKGMVAKNYPGKEAYCLPSYCSPEGDSQ